MSPALKQFILPDLLPVCPFKGSTNPHHSTAGAESSSWVNSYNIFTDRKRAFFIQGSNELLVSHTYPYADYEQFRTCCDFVNLLFVVDEISDDQCGKDARVTGHTFLLAMMNPELENDSKLARMTREFRTRFARHAGPGCMRRFLDHCKEYINCVVIEAELRERGEILDLPSFTALRRENSAIRLCFGLFEYVLGVDLPDEVFEDPVFMRLYWAAADMVCWSNDVYSYNMEQAKGISGNNVVTVLMRDRQIDLQAASDEVGVYFKILMDRFTADRTRLRSWNSSIDADVERYIEAMEHWVIGNLEWSFETQRYFGADHWKIKSTRLVTLRPCRRGPEAFE